MTATHAVLEEVLPARKAEEPALSVNVRWDAHHRGINDLEGENGERRTCLRRARMELERRLRLAAGRCANVGVQGAVGVRSGFPFRTPLETPLGLAAEAFGDVAADDVPSVRPRVRCGMDCARVSKSATVLADEASESVGDDDARALSRLVLRERRLRLGLF